MPDTPAPEPTLDQLDAAAVRHIPHCRGWGHWLAVILAPGNTYAPTLRRDLMGADADMMADALDAVLAARSDPRRAFRCDGIRRAA